MSAPKRPRNGDFPKWPDECKRHRWLPLMRLSTGKVIEPVREKCWHCGLER